MTNFCSKQRLFFVLRMDVSFGAVPLPLLYVPLGGYAVFTIARAAEENNG
jgi:hypothetical protein